jgi:hypothetical protein
MSGSSEDFDNDHGLVEPFSWARLVCLLVRVCIRVLVRVCIRGCLRVCIRGCLVALVFVRVCMRRTCACLHSWMPVCVCVNECAMCGMRVQMCALSGVFARLRAYTHKHTHVHTSGSGDVLLTPFEAQTHKRARPLHACCMPVACCMPDGCPSAHKLSRRTV